MISVGVPVSKLQAHNPRGVVRVARAITERLVAAEHIKVFAISDPIYSGSQVVCECWPMDVWLEWHPMRIATRAVPLASAAIPTIYRAWVHYLVTVLAFLRLRAAAKAIVKRTRPIRSAIKNSARAIVDHFGLGVPARWLWRLVLRCAYRSSPTLRAYDQSAVFDCGASSSALEEPDPRRETHCPWPADSDEEIGMRGYVALGDLDVILSFECFDAIWDWPIEFLQCRVVGIFHDAIPFRIHEGQHSDPGAYYRSVAKMVARASAIACDSFASQEDLHAFFPTAVSKTRVIHLGHDRERFAPTDARDEHSEKTDITSRRRASDGTGEGRIRHEVSTPRKKAGGKVKQIAMIGDIEPRKNQATVLRACRHLADLRPTDKLRLVFIGQVPDPNPYQLLERQASRFVEVQWLGYVPDDEIGAILRSCDAFVYASLWEGFGIPLLEAMTAGVPVVCSNNSSLPEVAGESAFYCDPYDPASIASAIDSALSLSSEERRRWIGRARERAATFRWSSSTREFRKLIEALAAKETRGRKMADAANLPRQASTDDQSLQRAAA